MRLTKAGQEIAPLPPIADPVRRALCDMSFRAFCDTYFPMVFTLPWSPDHLRVIAKIELVVKANETLAIAMPRGSGKSSLCMIAVLWAICSGWHKFVMLIASDGDHADKMLENIKSQIERNDLLAADYPEVCYPVRRLEGETRRCSGQRYYGVPTLIEWGKSEVHIARLPSSVSSGAIIQVAGLTGAVRGAMHVTLDGSVERPSLVICDDPQTDATARSHIQTQERLDLLNGAVTGLAGPGKRTAIIIPCTVIRPGDMADTILDPETHPEWRGERTRMVNSWPKNDVLWADYRRMREDSLRAGGDGASATDFYLAHRAEMDEGSAVSWPERFEVGKEVSAIQHAMNIRFKIGDESFAAEYQNDPMESEECVADALTVDDILSRLNKHGRGVVPDEVTRLTAYVDVQGELLYWMVCGWGEDFSGYVIDYGTFPDQRRLYFTLTNAAHTLSRMFPQTTTLEARIYAGLDALWNDLGGREWHKESGTALRVERGLIDANWGQSTDVVYQFCRQSRYSALLMPSHGKFVGASSVPFAEYKRKLGERLGHHWRIPGRDVGRSVRHMIIDTNYWKSFVESRMAMPLGERGGLTLFGDKDRRSDVEAHRLLADHLTAEYRVRTTAQGRKVDEWKWKAERPDNHWLDCLTGCAAAASERGCQVLGDTQARNRVRKRVNIVL